MFAPFDFVGKHTCTGRIVICLASPRAGAAGDVRTTDLPEGCVSAASSRTFDGRNQSVVVGFVSCRAVLSSSLRPSRRRRWDRRRLQARSAAQFAGIAAVIDGAADEIERRIVDKAGETWIPRRAARPISSRYGCGASRCDRSRDVGRLLPPRRSSGQRMALIVSDGMGTGPRAAAESEAAAAMLERFLLEGFGLKFAVQMINSCSCCVPPTRRTRRSTSVCLIWSTARCKCGRPERPRRTCGGGNTWTSSGRTVCLSGFCMGWRQRPSNIGLAPGDLVVMVTDGALEAARCTDDKADAVARVAAATGKT